MWQIGQGVPESWSDKQRLQLYINRYLTGRVKTFNIIYKHTLLTLNGIKRNFKWPSCKVCKAWFTTVPLKVLSDQVRIKNPYFCLYKLLVLDCDFSEKVICAFFHFILNSKHFSEKNDTIFQICDQIKVSRVPL